MLLKAQSITKSFGTLKVLTDVSLQINENDSIGLIGANGSGKSTFLKIILGELKSDTGDLIRNTKRIGYLNQFAESSQKYTVRDVLGRPYHYTEEMKSRLKEIEDIMIKGGNLDWNTLAEEGSNLRARLTISKLNEKKNLEIALQEVGLSTDIMDRTMDSLSGGERTKVMLSRIIIQTNHCDLLIMDEPTSHLDVNTIEWLEDYLLKVHCSILVVSHDRYFLDKISTRIIEIDHGKSREYNGNYSDFVMKKMLDISRMEKEYKKYKSQKKKQEDIAQRLHKDQWYMATHKTRQKFIEKMEKKEKPEESKEITIRINYEHKSGKNVLISKNLAIEIHNKTILENVNLNIDKGDKIGIFGSNGEGKSTLIKAIFGIIPFRGYLWIAPGAKIGYYSQNYEELDMNLTAEEQILQVIGNNRKMDARSMLARFLLTTDDITRPIYTLSGGQRARVMMCFLLLNDTNVLFLDEPTNYLDIPTRYAVERALIEYRGTILVVTHDRYLLDTVCTKVIEVANKNVKMFAGTYSQVKGRPNVKEIVMDADEYRVLSPFTNWVSGRKYSKGERVLVTSFEEKSFEWALQQGKLKKTGGRQRKKIKVNSHIGDDKYGE